MPDSVLNVQAVDTAINSDAYMPGLSNPTTAAEVKDIYMSSQFPTRERIAQLQELRREMVSRDSVDVEAGLGGLIAEIDRGRESLRDYAKSKLAVMSRENPELEIPQIRHGNYITSYNNLENSYVKKGDKIIVGQKIGRIFTDKVSKKTKLVFVLFKNTTRLNPASWMLKR